MELFTWASCWSGHRVLQSLAKSPMRLCNPSPFWISCLRAPRSPLGMPGSQAQSTKKKVLFSFLRFWGRIMQWKIFRTSLLQSRDQWNPETSHSQYDRGDGVVNVCERCPSLPGLWTGNQFESLWRLLRSKSSQYRGGLIGCTGMFCSFVKIRFRVWGPSTAQQFPSAADCKSL